MRHWLKQENSKAIQFYSVHSNYSGEFDAYKVFNEGTDLPFSQLVLISYTRCLDLATEVGMSQARQENNS